MLIRKGHSVHFVMEDGKARVGAPRAASMLHDPAGSSWGKCSLLFVRVQKGPAVDKGDGEHRDYLGKNHTMHQGSATIPPRPLAGWEKVGKVSKIFYTRTGTKAPGRFKHPYGERTAMFLFTKGDLPTLYKRGNAMRLEHGSGCIFDDRGIVRP